MELQTSNFNSVLTRNRNQGFHHQNDNKLESTLQLDKIRVNKADLFLSGNNLLKLVLYKCWLYIYCKQIMFQMMCFVFTYRTNRVIT